MAIQFSGQVITAGLVFVQMAPTVDANLLAVVTRAKILSKFLVHAARDMQVPGVMTVLQVTMATQRK